MTTCSFLATVWSSDKNDDPALRHQVHRPLCPDVHTHNGPTQGKNAMSRSKFWVFTQNFKDRPVEQPEFDAAVVKFAVWQQEKGDSGTDHLQGYVELHERARLTGVKKLLKYHPHWEVRKGSQEQAIRYCEKDETRVAGPWRFGTFEKVTQGQRSDLIVLRDAVRSKRSAYDMLQDDEVATVLLKHPRAYGLALQAYQQEATRGFRKLHTTVLWGPTGSGKTRKAMESSEKVYKWSPCQPEWWDGYQGEDTIVIDEFYGQMKPARMLELLDGYECRLPIKGGHVYAAWTKVFITSNKKPSEWYSGSFMAAPLDDRVKAALDRRLHTITYLD